MNKPSNKILRSFGIEKARLEPFGTGLMNETWLVTMPEGEHLVLQRLHSIFPAEINQDINTVTHHLSTKGLSTPRILPTLKGSLSEEDQGAWRMMTYIDGVSRDAIENAEQAKQAGALLARFHHAVSDLDYNFRNARLGVHDTARHIDTLKNSLISCKNHPHFEKIKTLSEEVLNLVDELPALPELADRIVHGDPKISNVIFDSKTDEAICLIDLDTLTRMPVILELGDAMRSWCNLSTEDDLNSTFSLKIFRAAVEGYGQCVPNFLHEKEWRAIPDATLTITVELAARFCTDALVENYFRWNHHRFQSCSEHNQARTNGQLSMARSIWTQYQSMHEIVEKTFSA